ncbi:MAG: undecaprenyl-phosphate glucose phosphotransferase [Deltaproteobacteria bacterium]|nr:undecaprenyl-phosphate glucose phosphotransferase [Deltaproteobacteria bacterium]
MLKERRQLFVGLFVAADLTMIGLAWVLAYVLRFELPLVPVTKGTPPFENYLALLPLLFAIWGLVFRGSGLYDPMRAASQAAERRRILRASSLAMLIFTAVTFLGVEKAFSLSRLTLLYFYVLATAAVILERATLREVLREARRRGYNLRHVLLVGDGNLGRAVYERMTRHPEFGLKVRGFLTDDPARIGGTIESVPICGQWDDVPDIVAKRGIDQVVFALPFEALPRLGGLIASLDSAAVDVKVVPDVERFVSLHSGIEEFGGLPLISLRATPLMGWNRVAKRVMDFVLAGLALVLLSPVLALISVLVKLGSPGPILFSQERMGLDGRVFRVWKFRTMRSDAEADSGPVWATADDPRRTRLGRWLRRLSLDELPQLLNVLRGEMSLVGPRPERPVFIEQFRSRVPRYMLRHMVQAGMTGWAQVNGWRGNTSIEQRIEHDLYYIQNWSLRLDLKILMLTFVRGFVNKNAY